MEYSLQIDLAICLNTEYVWTKRTKIAKQINICFAIFIMSESMQEPHNTKTDSISKSRQTALSSNSLKSIYNRILKYTYFYPSNILDKQINFIYNKFR